MFVLEEIFDSENVNNAFAHFSQKKNGSGSDGVQLDDLQEYWHLNHERIENEILTSQYQPGVIKFYDIVNQTGKKRSVSAMNVTERFICRLLSQKLSQYIEPNFKENSYAYQKEKGVLAAVQKAKQYVEDGCRYVAEIDVQNFFDEISIELLIDKLAHCVADVRVILLIKKYLYCKVLYDGNYAVKNRGLVQGNSMSPILANFYMDDLDSFFCMQGWKWLRFSDNIYIFDDSQTKLGDCYNKVSNFLDEKLQLQVNVKKSGIYNIKDRRILGYEFLILHNGSVDIRKYVYQRKRMYNQWHPSALEKSDKEYHVVQNGILNKKDYALLFENEDGKYHIPSGVTDQINLYGDVTVTSAALQAISRERIRIALFDRYGRLTGYFMPEQSQGSSEVLLKQCVKYSDEKIRLETARRLEMASLHNMRYNQRYYFKKNQKLKDYIDEISQYIKQMNEAVSVNELLLLEARAKQTYYLSFNEMIRNGEFYFTKRTKRPPKDELK